MAARDCKIETGQAGFESTLKRPEKQPWRVLPNDDLLFNFGDFAVHAAKSSAPAATPAVTHRLGH
jgi:hypothetical protein